MKAILKEKMFDVKLMALLERKNQVILQYVDERTITEIAADWEGADVIKRVSENEGNKIYKGYKRIMRIMRKDDYERNLIEIVLGKNK